MKKVSREVSRDFSISIFRIFSVNCFSLFYSYFSSSFFLSFPTTPPHLTSPFFVFSLVLSISPFFFCFVSFHFESDTQVILKKYLVSPLISISSIETLQNGRVVTSMFSFFFIYFLSSFLSFSLSLFSTFPRFFFQFQFLSRSYRFETFIRYLILLWRILIRSMIFRLSVCMWVWVCVCM